MPLSRRERLMRTLRGETVDRPAVSFYEIGGFRVDPHDPDPFNIYHAPDWQPLLRLAEERTDLIRMMSPVRAQSHQAWGGADNDIFRIETRSAGNSRYTRQTVRIGRRVLTAASRRDAGINTVWTTEHLLKTPEDVDAYLQIPVEALTLPIDTAPILEEERRLGDRGIVMIDTEDPLCAAATLFDMQDYLLLAFSDRARFHRLLERHAAILHARTAAVARALPGRLWRIYGPEYASEPYLPPRLFDEYVVPYVRPMVQAIQAHGGFARLHCHGRLRNILPAIAGLGVDATDPLEPPPQGDIALDEVRERYGRQLVLFGNIEVTDIEGLAPETFAPIVQRTVAAGTHGAGRGFVLMPTASPYGRTIAPAVLQNYTLMLEAVGA